MHRILFICHGNICRSPMAEFIFKNMMANAGRQNDFFIDSAATSSEEIGNPVYPPARRILAQHGIDCNGKTARRATKDDYDNFDYILCAEDYNIYNLKRIMPDDTQHKIRLMTAFEPQPHNISDPWYSGDFNTCCNEIHNACKCLLDALT